MEKPFSQACENNKAPILEQLKRFFSLSSNVLEIGSGTGQHALHFAEHLPHLKWQPSDREENISGMRLWLNGSSTKNLFPTIELDVNQPKWPRGFDAVFSANTVHIMPWISVVVMLQHIGALLPKNGLFALYGPFKFGGRFTSDSNAKFDEWLKDRARHQGIRDIEKIEEVAQSVGLHLTETVDMPANNHLLLWQKK